jgi:iron complex outermembrane receptor protein
MTLIRNLLSDAVRYGLAAGAVGLAGLAATPAFAQNTTTTTPNTDTTKAKNLDRVEVIGSRIRRAVDTEPTQPVTTLTRADIEQTGLTTTFDIINHISASDGSGLSTVTTQTNGSDGTQTVSLRNLGAQRTLVLVDGKRWATDSNGIVDLSSIPVAIIERIEVLKDGASAIYGSDAVAGVINIITRKKYDGAQVGWYYGQTTRGDGSQNAEDVTIGAVGERSSGVIAVSRSEQKAIFAGDRERSRVSTFGCAELLEGFPQTTSNTRDAGAFAKRRAGACGSGFGQFGRFFGPGVGGVTLNNSFTAGNWQVDPLLAHATAPGTKPSDFHKATPLDRYNFSPVNYLQQPATRNNLFLSGRFDITDNISAYARASYTQRQSSQQLAQVPTSLSTSGGFGPQWAFGASGQSVFNPFGTPGNRPDLTTILYRNVPVGPRHNNYDFNTLSGTAGVQGSFSFADRNFDWDVYAQYNSNRNTKIGEHYINLFNLQKSLGPSFADGAGLHCGTPGAIIGGCVPYNIFGGPTVGVGNQYVRSDNPLLKYTVTAADAAAMINYISYTQVATNAIKGINYGGNISGEILPLPGGMLSFAAGFETRRENAIFQPDTLVASGGSSDNFTEPTSGHTKVDEYYFELDAPLLKDVMFAKELEFNAAVRKSNYKAGGLVGVNNVSTSPGAPTNYKFSVRWKPFNDLLLRGSYGDTFRAPSVNDLFSGGSENFPTASDPCNTARYGNLTAAGQAVCTAGHVPTGGVEQLNVQIRGLAGGNPFLKPEHGKNLTYGFVWSPSWSLLNGLNVTVDYWRINLKDALSTLGTQSILDFCYLGDGVVGPGDPKYCTKVVRVANGSVQEVRTSQFNASTLKVDGVDFGVTYKYDTTNWGNFGLKWDTTYNRHETQDGVDFIGIYNGTPNWKYRSVATLDWKRGDWDAAWTMRYVSKLDENSGCNSGLATAHPAAPHVDVPNNIPGLTSNICNHPDEYSSLLGGQQPTAHNAVGGLGFNRIGATTYHDVQVGWRAPWKAHLSVGARNVFGKEPPYTRRSFANSFDASYDLPGGPFYYFQYRQDF